MSSSGLPVDQLGPKNVNPQAATALLRDMKVRVRRKNATTHEEVLMLAELIKFLEKNFEKFNEASLIFPTLFQYLKGTAEAKVREGFPDVAMADPELGDPTNVWDSANPVGPTNLVNGANRAIQQMQ